MYFHICGRLLFLILEKWPSVGDALCLPTAYSPLVIEATCSKGPPRGLCRSFCCGKLTLGGVWQAWLSPSPVGCRMLLCVDANGWWLVGLGLWRLAAEPQGFPRTNAGSAVDSHSSVDSEACPLVGGAMPQPSVSDCLQMTVGSGSLQAAGLLIGGAVFLPS